MTTETQTDKEKKESNMQLYVWLIGFGLGGLIVTLFFSVSINYKQQIDDYYHDQALQLCSLSNSYRDLLLTKNPEMETIVPSAVDCDRVLLNKTLSNG
jgi:hypothetical protein